MESKREGFDYEALEKKPLEQFPPFRPSIKNVLWRKHLNYCKSTLLSHIRIFVTVMFL